MSSMTNHTITSNYVHVLTNISHTECVPLNILYKPCKFTTSQALCNKKTEDALDNSIRSLEMLAESLTSSKINFHFYFLCMS